MSPPRFEQHVAATDIDRDKEIKVQIWNDQKTVHYDSSNRPGYFAGRTYADMMAHLFPDEFDFSGTVSKSSGLSLTELWREQATHENVRRRNVMDQNYAPPYFGGYNRMMADGNNILSIGCGPATGEARLSILHPELSVMGIDIAIRERNKFVIGAKGLQMACGDAGNMRNLLPDNSIDGIIESQSATAWTLDEKELRKQAREKSRVAKIGAVMRITCMLDDDIVRAKQQMKRYYGFESTLKGMGWATELVALHDPGEYNLSCVMIAAEKQR